MKDGIPSLTDPPLVAADSPAAAFWAESDRVIGLVLDGQAVAVPLNIMWWHEIVNLNLNLRQVLVTHCPLTGSSLAFDRAGLGIDEFGVSGLLFQNNLVMYDRQGENADGGVGESLWPQMARGARCGALTGLEFSEVPVLEITWAGWKALHPNTLVLSPATGIARGYRSDENPYFNYQDEDNPRLLFPMPIDPRRPPKERVLGIPNGTGGVAFPFGSLEGIGPVATVHGQLDGESFVVLWDADARAAMAYRPELEGQVMTFAVNAGRIEDLATGSGWDLSGRAVSGPLAGGSLEPVADAYVAFWFAWLPFQPDMELWTP